MDIITERKSAALLRRIASRGRTKPIVPQKQYKPHFDTSADCTYFKRAEPESQGISSEMLCDFVDEMLGDRKVAANTLLVLRNGKVICEAAKYPYRFDTPHVCYSFSKTVIGLAICILIDEGRISLDDRVQSFFGDIKPAVINPLLRGLKVRHLMNMTSGVRLNEFAAVTETDWVRCFLESVPKTEPGTVFEYNSMNSYMLSAIVTEVTGLTAAEYLETRLFAPLEIKNKYWSSCPKGINCGGWGLYLLPEDMAKLGQLILQRGEWNGRQIVSKALIDDMCLKQADVPKAVSHYNYGYQIWVCDDPEMIALNGMFGQNTLVFPKNGIIVGMTCGNENLFHDNISFDICTKYFGDLPEFVSPLRRDAAGVGALRELCRSYGEANVPKGLVRRLIAPVALPAEAADWDGAAYLYKTIDSASTGVLPLTLQCCHNCFAKGITRTAFDIVSGKFVLTVAEGNSVYKIPIGFAGAESCEIKAGDDSYRVATVGRFMVDENDNDILLVKMHFIEMGAVRIMRFEPHGDRIETTYSEIPGADFFTNGVSHMICDIKNIPVIRDILAGGGSELLKFAARQAFVPTATGLKMR